MVKLEDIVFSISRINSFHTCENAYYRTYELKDRGVNGIYGKLGTAAHSGIENILEGKMNTEEAFTHFEDTYNIALYLDGNSFPSESSGENYKECIRHYFENFKDGLNDLDFKSAYLVSVLTQLGVECINIDDYSIEIEKLVEGNINGVKFKGYVDLIIYNKKLKKHYVIDFKTSTLYTGKKHLEANRQLLVYMLLLNEFYEYNVELVAWDFLKYCRNNKGTVKERIEIGFGSFSRAIVIGDIKDEHIEELKYYLRSTADEIVRKMNTNFDAPKNINQFFCKTLCGHSKDCEHYHKAKRMYYKKK